MVLEATVLVQVFKFGIHLGSLDNSEWMRNGDYTPSRLEAQNDAATFLFNAKTQSNPENTVSLMTMGGKRSVYVSHAQPVRLGHAHVRLWQNHLGAAFCQCLWAFKCEHWRTDCSSTRSLENSLQQLVLKHRQNKNQKQRIIVFVASPVQEDEASLVKLGKKLKKNNVAVDIVNFGEEEANTKKLEALIEAVNSGDNRCVYFHSLESHLVSVPPGPHILSDVLVTSSIMSGEDGMAGVSGSGAGFEFGVDPSLDPELALV